MRALLALAVLFSACSPSAPPAAPAPTAEQQSATPAAPAAAAPTAAQLQAADFAAYPTEVYTGARHLPDFAGAQRAFRDYRTALNAGLAQGPNFAGHYALVQIGCGAGCNETYQVDLSSGDIVTLAFTQETAAELQSRADSALLKVHWFISPSDPSGDWRCHFENYVLRGGQLVSLGQTVVNGPCPDE